MSEEIAISVQDVSKTYRIWSSPRARLTVPLLRQASESRVLPHAIRQWSGKRARYHCREFFALRDISFEVPKGGAMGIVGHNGSGKSTMLKLIAGTIRPTRGSVHVNGRVAAMLELAAGFNLEFTGRENVFLSASILGLKRPEIERKFDSIVSFADIGEFLDQPVKTYSSGMLVRLAFAVHTAVEPEILIIDEALSVGDETFRRKCYARLDRIRDEGTTILFVSHDLGAVLNRTRTALFLHRGEVVLRGTPKYVVNRYQKFCHAPKEKEAEILAWIREEEEAGQGRVNEEENEEQDASAGKAAKTEGGRAKEVDVWYDPHLKPKSTLSYDEHGATISDVEVTDTDGKPVNLLQRRKWYVYTYKVRFDRQCQDVTCAMLIKTMDGLELGGSRSFPVNEFIDEVQAGSVYRVRFKFQCNLVPGVYFLNAGVEGSLNDKRTYLHRLVDAAVFRVVPETRLMPTALIDFLIEPEMTVCDDSAS